MAKICGEIRHTEKTIQQMFQVEYHTYEKLRMLVRAAAGAVLILLALNEGLFMAVRGVLLLAGCWLLISPDFPAACRADRSVMARGGALPVMRYCFEGSGVTVEEGGGKKKLPYTQIQRLVEDQDYVYLFFGKKSVCMVEKKSLVPPSAEDLKALLERQTGLKWTRDWSLLSMNLKDLMQAVQDQRQKK